MRCLISMLTLAGEFALYQVLNLCFLIFKMNLQAVCKRFCIGVGRFFVLFSLISTGMFISRSIFKFLFSFLISNFSSAFLPSSFAMAMNMLAMAAYLRERWYVYSFFFFLNQNWQILCNFCHNTWNVDSIKHFCRFWAIFCTAVSGLVGWPFAAILGLPIVIDMLFIRCQFMSYLTFGLSLTLK